MENKKLAIAAVIMAPIIPAIGLVLAINGVCKYPKGGTGKALSWAALYVSVVTAATGLLVSIVFNHMMGLA